MRLPPLLTLSVVFVVSALSLCAEAPALLKEAVARWLGERDNWAFKQHVLEFDGEKVEQERQERYDPSKPEDQRWTLISIDGREPEADEWAAWNKRKNKKSKKERKPIEDYFDLENAWILGDDERIVRYALPLRGTVNWLFPIDKVRLSLTVNKHTRAIERADATIGEPFKVVLGLARVLDLDLDLQILSTDEGSGPSDAKPDGQVRAVVTKLGQRVEYVWSDFVRITPQAERPAGP